MRNYGGQGRSRIKTSVRGGNYGADGQITDDVSGAPRTSDQLAGGSGYPTYPPPGEHALSAPTPKRTFGKSPSQGGTQGEDAGAGPDRRTLGRGALRITTGARTGAAKTPLGRAKVMLSERLAGRGASPGNHGIEGAPGGNREFGSGEHGTSERGLATGSPISQTDMPGKPVSPSDLHHGGGTKGVVTGDSKTGAGNRQGASFPFGGHARGGRRE
jgi:hypothetical protein